MLITISGPSGTGKSVTAKLLSKKLGIPAIDVGALFRAMAKKRGMTVVEFGQFIEAHPNIDRKLDESVIKKATASKNAILQSRLAGWMAKKYKVDSYKIWLGAATKVRAKRIADREGIPYEKALADMKLRDADNRRRYKLIYGLDVNDRSVYDAVIPTDTLSVDEVVSILLKKLQSVWPKKPNRAKQKPKTTPQPRRK